MLVPIANVLSGFLLAAPKFMKKEAPAAPAAPIAPGAAPAAAPNLDETVAKAHSSLVAYQKPLGIITLILGVLALIGGFGMWYPWGFFYGGPLQAIAAIVMGLLLCSGFLSKWPKLQGVVTKWDPYREWIGIAGGIVGIIGLI